MKNDIARLTGTKIGITLEEQGRRQDWLAQKVGVSPATVNRWIRGHRTIDVESAKRVADALGVPFSLLFDIPTGTKLNPSGVVA